MNQQKPFQNIVYMILFYIFIITKKIGDDLFVRIWMCNTIIIWINKDMNVESGQSFLPPLPPHKGIENPQVWLNKLL